MPRLNLITPPWQAQSEVDSGDAASSLIDGVFTDRGALVARPGLLLYKQVVENATKCQGIFWWQAKELLLVVFDTKIYVSACTDAGITFTHINSGVPTHTGTCIFAANKSWVYIVSGAQVIRWDGDLTAAAAYDPLATAVGLDEVSHVAYIDGYILGSKVDSQSWYYAEPDPVSDTNPLIWSATGLTAEGSPDNVKALQTAWREVLVLGADSAEVWYDSGDATTPFQRLEGAFIEQGTLSPYSLAEANNTWFWLNEQKQVVLLQGRSPSVISGAIREELENIQIVYDAVGTVFLEFYILTFPSAEVTWVYDLVKQHWSRWGAWSSTLFRYSAYRAKFSVWGDKFGVQFAAGESGEIYIAERTLRSDNKNLIRTEFISKSVDHGTFEYKFCHEVIAKYLRGSSFRADSLGQFAAFTYERLRIPYNEAFYFQLEPRKILGSYNWTYAWTGLPTGLAFTAATREIEGTATATGVFATTLTVTNGLTGFVVQFPIEIESTATATTAVAATEDRVVDLSFQDENQAWSTPISLDAGDVGDTNCIRKLAPMGRYSTRRYRVVFPAAIDVAFSDLSETVEAET